MKFSALATALAVTVIPATTVLGDRHAHAPPEALAAMVARRDAAAAALAQPSSHHMMAAKRHAHHHAKRGSCPARLKKQKVLQQDGASASATPAAAVAQPKEETQQPEEQYTQSSSNNNDSDGKNGDGNNAQKEQSKQEEQPKEVEQPKQEELPKPSSSGGALGGYGLFGFTDKTCGSSGATDKVTKTTGPNGSMDFLNCGLYGGGWTPPTLHLDNILTVPLDEALEDPNTPYGACRPYVHLFDKYGAELGIPPILIAAIAMQESSCNKDITGGDGSLGLMQITKDKCAAGVDCKDPDYNVRTGAQYLKGRLDQNNGNLMLALGQYNGWYTGLTVAKATAIKAQCCGCQQDLNYFQKLFNGWLQNVDGSTLGDWDRGC